MTGQVEPYPSNTAVKAKTGARGIHMAWRCAVTRSKNTAEGNQLHNTRSLSIQFIRATFSIYLISCGSEDSLQTSGSAYTLYIAYSNEMQL
jgi:hypothetical protein